MRNHPAPGAKMPAGGTEFAPEPITCDRCDDPATRSWEGDGQDLDLCEDCHDALGRWLNR
ncbi:hypothetical protein HTZ84_22255 [Haloterrigena sp. SYSU A558-1]|uniref:GATA-type domain-containing protein n=1 Tax=Haloterrigena gelatinilytica TaxID=2741724 RepID=A0ABX2LHR0_9EURY|nr:hypothetical protein [Haloterrigena gelatinilytica]NUC74990.1 hypothetical protein [Haloterrigena gelatinilytica]